MPRMITIVLLLFIMSVFGDYNSPCFTRPTRPIPPDHLMATKTKPLVIGHRGNPLKYQENTLDGFKSLLDTNADGVELDVYLTKDEKLVAFHDDNAKKLTGLDKNIWDMTSDEIATLRVNTTIKYGKRVMVYDKPRPIPMLEDVLKAMKGTGKLVYIQIKPNAHRDDNQSATAGKTVAKMVTDMDLIKQVFINSVDPCKSLAVYQENPTIPTGYYYLPKQCEPNASSKLYQMTSRLPGLQDCLKTAQNDTGFFKGMFKYGDVLKAINASYLDLHYSLFDNPTCFNNTFSTLYKYYSPTLNIGAVDLYRMDDEEIDGQDAVLDKLVKIKVQRFLTDDVDRTLTRLGRTIRPTADPKATAVGQQASVYRTFLMAVILMLAALY